MSVKSHPEYKQESQNLAHAIETIQDKLDKMPPPIEAFGADQRGAVAVRNAKIDNLSRLKQERAEPYFGRVDWILDGSQDVETFYIGKVADPDLSIYSAWDTLPGQLFYKGKTGRERGRRLLKRTLEIKNDRVDRINDDFVASERAGLLRLVSTATVLSPMRGDDLLLALLDEHREGQMHDIIATIQEEQYQLITSPLDTVLVIQGVAGSGKTAIALHRIAYLLYQHEKSGELTRSRMLYLAPNPIFLHYVARVLPELGERSVRQMSFDEWLLRRLDPKTAYEPEERALETLLNPALPQAVRLMRYRNARNKGSLKMAKLLDRYEQDLAAQLLDELGAFSFETRVSIGQRSDDFITVKLRWGQDEIQRRFERIRNTGSPFRPLNACREPFQREFERDAVNSALTQLPAQAKDRDSLQRMVRERVLKSVREYLRPWETINVAVAYRGLLRSPERLHRVGEGIFDRWQLELLHADAPKQQHPLRFSDLSALYYLHLLLEPTTPDDQLEHVVIDEAQDITPLQFEVLRRLSRNQSFTIMGDLTQGIYADHGLHQWSELHNIFDHERITQTTVRRSYRSTQPIVNYANALLQRIGASSDWFADPLPRSGAEPIEYAFAGEAERTKALQACIERERTQGRGSIAIILQTAAAVHDLAARLEAAGIPDLQVIDSRSEDYAGGLAVLPAYLAKGLEFDTVFVADADANTYPPQALQAHLLYVALTRASHSLHVGWIGQVTPLLDATQPSVQLVDPYEEQIAAELVTIAEFAKQAPQPLALDICVDRLASAGKLYLLSNGRMDRTTLAVLTGDMTGNESDEGQTAPELDPQVAQAVRQQIANVASQPEHGPALAFLQLTYGLLRNVLRGVGITLDEEQDADMSEQAVALARFLNAIRVDNLGYTVGVMTTERRARRCCRRIPAGRAPAIGRPA